MLHRGVLEKEIIMFTSQEEAEKRGSESGKKENLRRRESLSICKDTKA